MVSGSSSISSFSSILISLGFVISSWRDLSSCSVAFRFSLFSPYKGTTSRREWFIILSSLVSISFGFSFSWRFFATSCAKSLVDSGISLRCSFGITRVCPLLLGLSSRIAMFRLSSDIL